MGRSGNDTRMNDLRCEQSRTRHTGAPVHRTAGSSSTSSRPDTLALVGDIMVRHSAEDNGRPEDVWEGIGRCSAKALGDD